MSHLDYVYHTISILQENFIIKQKPHEILYHSRKQSQNKKKIIFLGIEGAYLLSSEPYSNEPNLKNLKNLKKTLRDLKKKGITYLALSWNNSNPFVGTSREENSHKGLTKFGKILVRYLIEEGILIDLSHVSDQAIEDFYLFTKKSYPLFFSHSSIYKICPHPRNIKDRVLKQIKKTEGLVALNFHAPYLSCKTYGKNHGKTYSKNNATKKDLLLHMNYVRKNYGSTSIGLGSDFDAFTKIPLKINSPPKLRLLAKALYENEMYSKEEIDQIFHGNIVRVLKKITNKSFQKKLLNNMDSISVINQENLKIN